MNENNGTCYKRSVDFHFLLRSPAGYNGESVAGYRSG